MDLYSFQNIKDEKVKAMNKYRRMQKAAAVFRFVELCIFVFVFSRFSLRFPRAFKFPEVDFRGILDRLISPRFLFVVGNTIVIVLYRKSKGSPCSGENNGEMKKQSISVPEEEEEEGVTPAKRIKKQGKMQSISVSGEEEEEENPGKCRRMNRSRSEGWSMGAGPEERGRELRRSATTVKCRKSEEKGGGAEEMSSEEFRKKVEDFIARQQRLLREEESSAFVSWGK